MEYEAACNRLRDDVAALLLALERPGFNATSLAASATQHLADALHHASGSPDDARWNGALSSLARFVDRCSHSPRASHTQAFASLSGFLIENGLPLVSRDGEPRPWRAASRRAA